MILHTPKNLLMMSIIITSSNYIKFHPFYNKNFPGCPSTCLWTSWWRNPCFHFLAKPCTLNSHTHGLSYCVPVVCSVRRQANVASNNRSWTYANCECWQEPTLNVSEWRISSSRFYHWLTVLKQYLGDHKAEWVLWHDGWYHSTRIYVNRESETCAHNATNGSFVMRIMWKSTAVL